MIGPSVTLTYEIKTLFFFCQKRCLLSRKAPIIPVIFKGCFFRARQAFLMTSGQTDFFPLKFEREKFFWVNKGFLQDFFNPVFFDFRFTRNCIDDIHLLTGEKDFRRRLHQKKSRHVCSSVYKIKQRQDWHFFQERPPKLQKNTRTPVLSGC